MSALIQGINNTLCSIQPILKCLNALMDHVVIIDRVIKARLRHKKSQRRTPSRSNTPQYSTHATATARTQPLTPLNEKSGSEEFAHRPGGTTKRGGFWARFKCW